MIASWHHGGQDSALYDFASSGAVDLERLAFECLRINDDPTRNEIATLEEIQTLMAHFIALPDLEQGKRGPVDGWSDVWLMDVIIEMKPSEATEESESEPDPTPSRVWIGDLAAYNDGELHGTWVRADDGVDAMWQTVAEVLRTSPVPGAEEFFIADYEGFQGVKVDEYTSLETVAKLAERIAELGKPFAIYVDIVGLDRLDEAVESFDEAYLGHWPSVAAYVESEMEESDVYQLLNAFPEDLRPYVSFNVTALAEAWQTGDLTVAHGEGGVYICRTDCI